jgi:PST family polysaccharide transporter
MIQKSERFLELDTVDLKKKAVKGAAVNIITQSVAFVFQSAGVIILGRMLAPQAFGVVAMVTAFSLLPYNFGLNGFTEFIIQKEKISIEEIDSIFWAHVCISIILFAAFAIFGFALVRFYKEPALSNIAIVLATTFIMSACATTPRALLRRDMKYTSVAVGDLSAGIFSVAFAVTAASLGVSYWAIVTRQVSLAAIQAVAAWILCPWRPGRPRNLRQALPAVKYTLKVFGNFTAGYMVKSVDKVLIGRTYGSSVLGSYDRAYYLSSLPAGQL